MAMRAGTAFCAGSRMPTCCVGHSVIESVLARWQMVCHGQSYVITLSPIQQPVGGRSHMAIAVLARVGVIGE